MAEKSPQNREELAARFAKILGRKPTPEELAELDSDRQEHGLGYYDPVLIQLMAFKRERTELDKRLNGLNHILHRHEITMQKQLEEARDQVLKEADKALVKKAEDVEKASSAALAAEATRLLGVHRDALTAAVKESTKEAVKGKFDETWAAEWKKLQDGFKSDWETDIQSKLNKLNKALEVANEKIAWMWLGTLVLGLMLAVLLGVVWWERFHPSSSPESAASESQQSVKPAPKSVPAPGSRK